MSAVTLDKLEHVTRLRVVVLASILAGAKHQTAAVQWIERLVGVYDADGTLLGELAYEVGHLKGRRSCARGDITHGGIRRRPELDQAAAALGVPFDLLHRDERSPWLPGARTRQSSARRSEPPQPATTWCSTQPEARLSRARRQRRGKPVS